MNKKICILATTSLMALVATASTFAIKPNASKLSADLEHVGYHYAANPATVLESGNKEFYTCCNHGEQWLATDSTRPEGTFVERSIKDADGEIGASHIAYEARKDSAVFDESLIVNGNGDSRYQNYQLSSEPAPGIFENVYEITCNDTYFHGGCYSRKDFSDFDQLTFAVKTTGTFKVNDTQNARVDIKTHDWIYFTITNNHEEGRDNNTCDIKVQYGDNVIVGKNIRSCRVAGPTSNYVDFSLAALLYANSAEFIPVEASGATIYSTEVRRNTVSQGTVIEESLFKSSVTVGTQGIRKIGVNKTAVVPFKYSKVNEILVDAESQYVHGQFYSGKVVTEYNTVKFGLKTDVDMILDQKTGAKNTWYEFVLTNNHEEGTNNTWNIAVYAEGNSTAVHTLNNVKSYKGDNPGAYVNYALNTILYGMPARGFYPYNSSKAANWYIWTTEVVAL